MATAAAAAATAASASSSGTSVFVRDCLKGKVAFVTGGASGICKGIADAFMRHGADVVIISRKQERLDEASKELERNNPGRKCIGIAADVRQPKQVEAAVAETLKRLGRIDILINGAAGNFLCPIAGMSYNAFRTVIEIDTLGTFNVMKAVFEQWFRHGHGGSVINISATLHYTGMPLQAHVGAAKSAIDALTKHAASEWGSLGVRVNGIAPGPIGDTEGYRRLVPSDQGVVQKLMKEIPLQRMGRIDDIANAALYLATDASSYMTGHTMVVDGGCWFAGNINARL